MSNENHANYSRIGFAVVIGIAAIVGTLIYIGGFRDAGSILPAETYYDTPVSGLSVGSPVNFRGVKVGEVKRISFVIRDYPNVPVQDGQKIRITMAFDRNQFIVSKDRTPEDVLSSMVSRGLRATVTSSGITGLSRIELNYPKSDMDEAANYNWKPEYLVIPSAPSLIDSFSDAATKVMNQINRMDFSSTWSNIASIAESAAQLTANVNALIESQRSGINDTVENISSASRAIRDLALALQENPSLLLRPRDPEALPETKSR